MNKTISSKGGETMNYTKENTSKMYYTAAEIADMLDISRGKAYQIIRTWNQELAKNNYLTISGKIPVEYFNKKWYGAEKED